MSIVHLMLSDLLPYNILYSEFNRISTRYHTFATFNNPEEEILKTLMKKEKIQETSIFSFFQNVFYPS